MGKNIKSYATFPQSISPGKGREALRQKRPNVQIFLFKYGTVLPYTFASKITNKIFKFTPCLLAKIPANYANSVQFAHILCELRKIRTFHVPIILYVSDPCHSKELYKIPANQAEFVQFAHILHE